MAYTYLGKLQKYRGTKKGKTTVYIPACVGFTY